MQFTKRLLRGKRSRKLNVNPRTPVARPRRKLLLDVAGANISISISIGKKMPTNAMLKAKPRMRSQGIQRTSTGTTKNAGQTKRSQTSRQDTKKGRSAQATLKTRTVPAPKPRIVVTARVRYPRTRAPPQLRVPGVEEVPARLGRPNRVKVRRENIGTKNGR